MKYNLFSIAFLLILLSSTTTLLGQGVGINDDNSTPDASAMLDVKSTNKGMLVPRMTSTQRSTIAAPATGLLVFDQTTTSFWFYDGAAWIELASGNISGLSDTDLDTKIDVEQTTDADSIVFTIEGIEYWSMVGARLETNNTGNSVFIGEGAGAVDDLSDNKNVFMGYRAGYKTTTGGNNIATGYQALYENTTGTNNIGQGYQALYYNITGQRNIGLGYRTLYTNYTGNNNIAMGYQALYDNQSGSNNIGLGYGALYDNRTGENNVAMGYQALNNNSTSSDNIAIGSQSLFNNYWQGSNIAIGKQSMYNNEDGSLNVAIGIQALKDIWGGWSNVAIGYQAGKNAVMASYNVAIGYQASFNSDREDYTVAVGYRALYSNTTDYNTAIGSHALYSNSSGENNVAMGYQALYSNSTGNHNVAMGYEAGKNNLGTGSVFIGYQAGQTETAGERLYIDNSSTTTPLIYGEFDNDLLRINGTLNINNAFSFPITDGTNGQILQTNGTGTLSWVTAGDNLGNHTATANIQLNGNWLSNDGDSEGIYVNNTGYVGIGTNAPNATLTLKTTETDLHSGLQLSNGADDWYLYQNANKGFTFRDDGDDRITIDADGYVGIGTTAPAYQLQVNTNSAAKPTSSAWTVTSDRRLKNNISSFEEGLEIIQKIKPIWFNYNGKAGMPTNERGIGTIAQELQEIAPYMVKTWTYKNEAGEKEKYLAVDYGAMDFVLVNAVQEQQATIETQASRITTLEQELNALKALVTQTIPNNK